jgi:hypothetical protein
MELDFQEFKGGIGKGNIHDTELISQLISEQNI